MLPQYNGEASGREARHYPHEAEAMQLAFSLFMERVVLTQTAVTNLDMAKNRQTRHGYVVF